MLVPKEEGKLLLSPPISWGDISPPSDGSKCPRNHLVVLVKVSLSYQQDRVTPTSLLPCIITPIQDKL